MALHKQRYSTATHTRRYTIKKYNQKLRHWTCHSNVNVFAYYIHMCIYKLLFYFSHPSCQNVLHVPICNIYHVCLMFIICIYIYIQKCVKEFQSTTNE